MANAPPPEAFQFMLMYFCAGIECGRGREIGKSTHARGGDHVRVPSTAGYLEVVDPVLFLGWLAKDMSVIRISAVRSLERMNEDDRYFEARTKRDISL
jgi:hypothetical protein